MRRSRCWSRAETSFSHFPVFFAERLARTKKSPPARGGQAGRCSVVRCLPFGAAATQRVGEEHTAAIAGKFSGFRSGKKVLTRTMIEFGQIVEICFRPYHSKLAQPLTEP